MMRLTRSGSTLSLMALIMVGAVGVYISFFLMVRSNAADVSAMTNEVEHFLEEERRSVSMKALVENTADERARLDGFFVGPEGVVSFIETVEELGRVSGSSVEISSVNVREAPITSPPFEFLDMTIRAEGRWREVFHFFSLLESLPFYVEVRRVQFAAEEGGRWGGAVSISVAKLK